MAQTNLYDSRLYFALQFRDYTTLILEPKSQIHEPMNWEKMINHQPRDMKYYGFWSDFIEDKYGLLFTFDQDGGGDYLKNIYETYGDQSEVYFSFGYKGGKQIKSWRVNLQEYELDDGSDIYPFGGVMATIEKMPFQGKLKSRFNSPCTINSYLTMDGDLLTPISTNTIRLHSKTIEEETVAFTETPITTPQSIGTFFDTYLILQPDQTNFSVNELYQVFSQPCGFLDTQSRLPSISPVSMFVPTPTSGAPANQPPYTACGIYTGTVGSGTGGTHATSPLVFSDPFLNNISQYNPVTSGLLTITWEGGGVNTAFYYYKGTGVYGGGTDFWSITPRVLIQRLVKGVWNIVGEYLGTTQIISIPTATSPHPTSPMTGGLVSINGPSQQYILPSVTGSTPRGSVAQVIGYTFSEESAFTDMPVQAGDDVYVHMLLCPNKTSTSTVNGWIQIDNFFNTITYNQLTVTPVSTAIGYRAFDILTQMVENITGQKNAVKSPYFSFGGQGYNKIYCNGYSLRNFSALINQPKKSLQEFIDDIQAVGFIGAGIQEINGVENIIVDYAPDFFKTLTIARFTDTFEFKENHNSQLCYNSFQFGYNKWQGLDLKMEDEFNTNGMYLTQFLKYGDNQLSKMSNTIESGYMIEEQRRNQFQLNPSQSLTEDESWFGICTSEPNVFSNIIVGFAAASSTVLFIFGSMGLITGDTFTVSSGTNSGTLFTIVSEFTGFPIVGQDAYIISPAPVDEAPLFVSLTITPPSPDQVFAERNQPFKICSGVIDPNTIYNGRDSLKHILYNWSPLISVGLYFINPLSKDYSVSQIITTLVKMNSKFTTQFISSEPHKGNVGDLILTEFNREQISRLPPPLFSPIAATCKLRVGYDELKRISYALCGETGDETIDFGGLELADSSGAIWFCHVMDLRYDLVKEILTLNVQKVKKIQS